MLDVADHGSCDRRLSYEEEAYWQPQLPDAASPQQDAFSDGSQHAACLTGEQQLAAWSSTFSRSSDDAESIRVLRFVAVPVLRAVP